MGQANIESALAGVRALLAEELVARGYAQKDIARTIGTTPAAVTLYTRGRRGREVSERIRELEESAMVVKELADQMAERKKRGENVDEFPLILDAAYRVMRLISEEGVGRRGSSKAPKTDDGLVKVINDRIEQEQLAAQRNMTLAVSTKDEITRILFRQIATDSMRHADILGAIMNYIEKPTTRRPGKDEIIQIEAMIREEEGATERPIVVRNADPAIRLLLGSIDMDEQKHSRLLKGLLEVDRSMLKRKSG